MNTNLILATDSYKLTHYKQYPKDTEVVYSYFESRVGARFPYTVFFGLQYLLKQYLAKPVGYGDLEKAFKLADAHFGTKEFNYRGWEYIISELGGRLPLRIKAIPEGTVVPVGNVLMTVENTDPKCFWLTNALESLLTHVWYPSTVATLSYSTFEMIGRWLDETAMNRDALPFMLHDFGYRGASSHESAGVGGAGHLINGLGTDTLPAMEVAMEYYDADLSKLAFSVPATEHSVMTAEGREGEDAIVTRLLEEYPTGILSIVADSYDIYNFVERICTKHKDAIMARDGKVVVRPDSTTPEDRTPEDLTEWIVARLYHTFGGKANAKGYRTLDPHVGVLWGDGIDPIGIERILRKLADNSFSAENMVFGMGGGLLQKINRDTQRFAFKASAMERSGRWHDVSKEPLDTSKKSKAGRLQLSRWTDENNENPSYETLTEGDHVAMTADLRPGRDGEDRRSVTRDVLQTVYENGKIVKEYTFEEVRANARK